MAESSNDFGLVESIGAEAIGQPGQRTFRLVARSHGQFASLWMEKEQLTALGTALQQQIVRLGRPAMQGRAQPLLDGSQVPPTADVEFQCGQIGLGYDERRTEFVVLAYTTGAGEDDPADWSGRISVPQGRSLSREIERLVNAGRPKCPLCGIVIDTGGHTCPRANGHAKELSTG